MRRILTSFNFFILSVAFFVCAAAGLFLLFGAAANLMDFYLPAVFFSLIPLLFVFLFFMFLKFLWKGNREYAERKPGSGLKAAVIPILGVCLLFGILSTGQKARSVIRPSQAKGTHGNLSALKSALSIYFSDTEGSYPEELSQLTVQNRYLHEIPKVITMDHPDSDEVVYFPSVSPMDTGAWGYVNNPGHPAYGTVFIDCTHSDPSDAWGKPWVTAAKSETPIDPPEAVLERLKSGEGSEIGAIYMLGDSGPAASSAIPDLIQRLSSSRAAVRSAAAYALGRIGPPASPAIKELKRLRKDASFSVRQHADAALRSIGWKKPWWVFW